VKTTIDELLAQEDDFELCDGVFGCFADLNNSIEVESYTEEQRIVTLVWHASGIIGNGGFEYLFEGEFNGDPGFIYTAAAFATIGARASYQALQRALACFGSDYPSNTKSRNAIFERVPKSERESINHQFWDDDANMRAALARYIREHRITFRTLLTH